MGGSMAMEMHEFEVPQSYETTITMRHPKEERDHELEFQFFCLPVAAIHKDNRPLLDNPPALLSGLGAESTPLRVGQLPDAILTLLRVDYLGEDAGSMLELVSNPDWLAGQREQDPEAALFAEYLAFAEVVPFEQSEQKAAALATLARKSYSKSVGVARLLRLLRPRPGSYRAARGGGLPGGGRRRSRQPSGRRQRRRCRGRGGGPQDSRGQGRGAARIRAADSPPGPARTGQCRTGLERSAIVDART